MSDLSLGRWWRQAGLAVHLTTWYVALLAVALLALGVFLYVALAQSLELSTFAFLGGEARAVERVLQAGIATGQPLAEAATSATDNVAAPGVGVVILDPNGRVVAQSRGPREQAPDPPAAGLEAVRAGAGQWTGLTAAGTAVLLEPVVSGGAAPSNQLFGLLPKPKPKGAASAVVGYLQLSVPTAQTDATLHTVLLLLLAGVSLVLLLAALAGPRLTRLGLRPLRGLAAASHQLAQGDLAARVAVPASRDEVGALARAFNDMAERLEAAFAAQQAFVADASHELRTPLTALGGQLDVLPRALRAEPAEAERLAGEMRREVTRLSRLVQDLLALARLDAQGNAALRREPVDLTAVAHDVYQQARALPVAQGKDLRLHGDDTVQVHGDSTRLHQVLLNLVQNALQHAPAVGGWVLLSVVAAGEQAVATVQDNGPGIPAEHLGHVFDRFYRADAARARADGGAGLGLAIVRGIVEAHGGTVNVTVTPPGGAIFAVSLPLLLPTDVPEAKRVVGDGPGAPRPLLRRRS